MPPRLVTAGSVCVSSDCGAPRIDDPKVWSVLARIPEDVDGYGSNSCTPNGVCVALRTPIHTRDFIVAREYGKGHVIVYAHDGMTADNVLRESGGADNALVIENAIRWLMPAALPRECNGRAPTVVLWEGYVNLHDHGTMMSQLGKRWKVLPTTVPPTAAKLDRDLQCAGVLWLGNIPPRDLDSRPSASPPDFATADVPVIEAFVRRGGGLLVAGLGWSFYGLHPGHVQPEDVLGQDLGFRYTRDMFRPNGPIRLMTPSRVAWELQASPQK